MRTASAFLMSLLAAPDGAAESKTISTGIITKADVFFLNIVFFSLLCVFYTA
jgi:hypothetical protein